MKSYIVAGFLVLILMVSTVPFATRALEQSDIGAQIETLLARIAELQAKVAELQSVSDSTSASTQGGATPTQSCVMLNSNLGFGSRGDQVSKLQQFLGVDPTGYFGPLTMAAVQKWQAANGIVSSGTPESTGYGRVGPATRAAIGCSIKNLSGATLDDNSAIDQDNDSLFLEAIFLSDDLLDEGSVDIPIDDIPVTSSLNTSQVGATASSKESYNTPPFGYAGNIRNGVANGWTYDPDEPNTPIGFHVYIDGKVGDGTFIGGGRADKNRKDITKGEKSYNHWYSFKIPEEYWDGEQHTIYVYGIDSKGASIHNNTLLKNNPKTFKLVSITMLPPSCTLTATPASVTLGNSSTLSWTSTNATSGSIDNGAGAMNPINAGSKTVSPTVSTLYTATVTGAGGSANCNASVDVTTGGDTTKPTVSLTAPAANSTVSSTVTLSANASDNVGVTGVQFKVDGANVGAEDTSAPYSISWNTTTVTNGTHTIKAVAKDAAGNTRSTAGRSVTVVNGTADTTKPTVSLTAPADGATVSGNVTISANASDNVGVVGVQFKVDGANVGAEDTSAPYSIVWDSTTVTNGNHNIRAVARDAAGNTQWSALKKATVSNTVSVPRSVIHDPTYQSGFSVRTPESVLSYTTSNLYPFGNNNNSKPEWSSGQWGSQYPFSSTTPKTVLASGAVEYKTPGKRIVLGPGDYVLLGLNSSDWGSHIQRLGTASPVKGFLSLDPEQHRQDDIPISQLESVQYKMSFRLIKAETGGPGSGGAHAQANLRLVNNNPSSPGYKEWVYFIIKLYDNRYRTIPYQLKKDGGTGALLYRPSSTEFYGNKSAWDKQWITIDKDILPMFAKAIQTGYSKGYLKSNNLGDYVPRFTGVHWEMSALKSVEMEFKDFDMILTPKPGAVLGASTTQNPSFMESIRASFSNALGMVASVLQSLLQTAD